jgi:3-oxoacyl-[acyl-carrier protein] reductase
MTTISEAFDLTGKVALVTGAGRGLGRAISARLAEAGATVVCADIDTATATDTAAAIRADGHRAAPVHLDVTRRADVETLVDQIVADQGHLDVMVNNAAIIVDGLVLDTAEEDLDRVLAVNFKGVFFGCQAAGRVMVHQGSGSIINLASGAIDIPTPNLVCYSTAKVAVAQLSRTLAVELAPSGVRVNAIAPGWIDTPMNERHARRADGSLDEDAHAAHRERMTQISPMRMAGEPDDIAFAALYLAAPAAKFVTGIVMRPNGGSTMPW